MNKNNLISVLRAISEALNSGRNDVKAVVMSLISFILLLLLMSVILKIKNRSGIKRSSLAAYSRLAEKFKLSIDEKELIDKLSAVLKNPDKKYLLLVNKGTFRHALQGMDNLRADNSELVESIRVKVGFASSARPRSIFSSKSFKPGMPVLIEIPGNVFLHAEIHSVTDSVFTVKCSEDHESVQAGKHLRLFICTYSGFRTFSLQVGRVRGQFFSANHVESERITKLKTNFDVKLTPEHGGPHDTRKSAVLILAGNGAVILNPDPRLKEGDDIRIYLAGDLEKRRHVNAEVIRAPLAGRTVTVRYTHIRQ